MNHLYLALIAVVVVALIVSIASYVSLRHTYAIEDLHCLSDDPDWNVTR